MRFVVLLVHLLSLACGHDPVPPEDEDKSPAADWEPCQSDADCVSRVCAPRSEVCLPNECAVGCADGEVCADRGPDLGETCEPPGERGDDCFLVDDVGSFFDKECMVGLTCQVIEGPLSTGGSCVSPEGGACEVNDDCLTGFECSPTGTCRSGA